MSSNQDGFDYIRVNRSPDRLYTDLFEKLNQRPGYVKGKSDKYVLKEIINSYQERTAKLIDRFSKTSLKDKIDPYGKKSSIGIRRFDQSQQNSRKRQRPSVNEPIRQSKVNNSGYRSSFQEAMGRTFTFTNLPQKSMNNMRRSINRLSIQENAYGLQDSPKNNTMQGYEQNMTKTLDGRFAHFNVSNLRDSIKIYKQSNNLSAKSNKEVPYQRERPVSVINRVSESRILNPYTYAEPKKINRFSHTTNKDYVASAINLTKDKIESVKNQPRRCKRGSPKKSSRKSILKKHKTSVSKKVKITEEKNMQLLVSKWIREYGYGENRSVSPSQAEKQKELVNEHDKRRTYDQGQRYINNIFIVPQQEKQSIKRTSSSVTRRIKLSDYNF